MAVPNPRPAGDFRSSYRADQTLFQTRGARNWVVALVVAALFVPLVGDNYVVSQMILIGIYGIAALGLNVVTGFTGQISLGHAAFFGFGAFASAWLSGKGIPVLIAIPLAGLMTTAVGMIFGLPAARLKGLYLAIATLAAQFILQDFFARAAWFTGGPLRRPGRDGVRLRLPTQHGRALLLPRPLLGRDQLRRRVQPDALA